jgi:23S rRNA (cytidine1920-2'-O)/16S rRNA (cytidine1409-2'-O)-methyltransferase
MKLSDLPYIPDLCVMDVSFISATYIMPSIRNVLAPRADFICLIKPQFEVGKSGLGKGGIVKNDKIRKEAVDKVVEFARSIGFNPVSLIESPIVGGDGNIEFLAHFQNGESI